MVCPFHSSRSLRLRLVRGSLLCAWRLWSDAGTIRAAADFRRSFQYLACDSDGADACRARACHDGNNLPNRRGDWRNRKRMVVQLETYMVRSVPEWI